MQTQTPHPDLLHLALTLQHHLENIRQRQIRKFLPKTGQVSEELLDAVSRQVAERLLALSLEKVDNAEDPQALSRLKAGLSVLTQPLA